MGPIFTLLGAWGLMSQSTVPPCGSAQELVEVWGGGRVCITQEFKSHLLSLSLSSPTLQELGFTSFIRTLREGDLKKLEKRKEEL